ncbi:MAG: type II secretion system protein [Candidatus Uhrbacteria bacterium]
MQKRKGFTLIELLVVIAIIGLLATLAVIAVSSARVKARDARRISDVKQLQSALELYASSETGYPIAGGALIPILGEDNATCLSSSGFEATCTAGSLVYMQRVPSNPSPGGVDYTYIKAGNCDTSICTDYSIGFELEDKAGDFSGCCTATSSGISCTDAAC